MWLRLLAMQFLKGAAANQVRSMAMDAVRTEMEGGEAEDFAPCEIAFIFALQAESGGLVDLLEKPRYTKCPTFIEWAGLLEGRSVVVAEVGVGVAAAKGAADCIAVHRPRWVVSAGFAGGLGSELKKGHLVMAPEIANLAGETIATGLAIDATTVSPGLHVGRLLTVDRIIREPEEKRSLGERHAAIACDMETFAIGEVCRTAGVPLISVRVISDTVDDRLPAEIEHLLAQKSLMGQLGSAAAAVMNRFSAIGDMWRLYEDALKCSQRLARFLTGLLPQLK